MGLTLGIPRPRPVPPDPEPSACRVEGERVPFRQFCCLCGGPTLVDDEERGGFVEMAAAADPMLLRWVYLHGWHDAVYSGGAGIDWDLSPG